MYFVLKLHLRTMLKLLGLRSSLVPGKPAMQQRGMEARFTWDRTRWRGDLLKRVEIHWRYWRRCTFKSVFFKSSFSPPSCSKVSCRNWAIPGKGIKLYCMRCHPWQIVEKCAKLRLKHLRQRSLWGQIWRRRETQAERWTRWRRGRRGRTGWRYVSKMKIFSEKVFSSDCVTNIYMMFSQKKRYVPQIVWAKCKQYFLSLKSTWVFTSPSLTRMSSERSRRTGDLAYLQLRISKFAL